MRISDWSSDVCSSDLSENILAGPAKRPAMFWRSGDYRAVRAGDWKLQVSKRPEKARLYNLAADPTESTDLAARDPRRVAELGPLMEAQNTGRAEIGRAAGRTVVSA